MDSYQRKAGITTKMLNSLTHVSCNPVTGSLYAFPKVILPQKAVEEAKVRRSSSKPIDLFLLTDTAAILNLLYLRRLMGCPGSSRPVFIRAFQGQKENFCIFLGKNAIIITSKQGTTIFFSHYNLFLGNLKENWSEKRA